MSVRCFLLERTDRERIALRRYSDRKGSGWSCAEGWHEARVAIGERKDEGQPIGDSWPHDDPRWPTECERGCGYTFRDDDFWQLFLDDVWRRTDTDEEMTLSEAPPGAMWFADWLPVERWKGPDGRTLMVRTPGGDWVVDSIATNCTKPEDEEHRCWIRHGTPPNVTVDKNGNTCAAGAGSIGIGSYHGFLQGGHLT